MAYAINFDASMAPVLACLKGIHALSPIDPTCEFTRYIPYLRTVNKLNVASSDYSDKKNVTIPYFTTKCVSTESFFICDNFTPQYASRMSDKMCYCDYPAINQFRQIEVKVNNHQIETITPLIAINRLREIFVDNWTYITNNLLGGSSETNHRNQKLEGFSLKGNFNKSDLKQNIIKPAYRWFLPIPASIFTNKDKFKFNLALNSMVEFGLNFASIKTWITNTPDFVPQEVSGTLDVYVVGANPNEYAIYFNNLPHVMKNPTENYYVNDVYDEFSDKRQPHNVEQKVLLRQGPTKEMRIYYTNGDFCSGYRFFGNTIREAAENFIASHVNHVNTSTTSGAINLATGLFPDGRSEYNMWKIEGWSSTGRSFLLKYKKNNTITYGITVTCTTAWGDIGTLYLDLDTYVSDTRLSRPQLLYFETFNLDVRPYDNTNISFLNLEDKEITAQGSYLLVNGFYTYQPDQSLKNTMAFWGVTNIKPSLHVEDPLYNFSLSQPVTISPNNAHYCVQKKQVFINRPNFNYDDLDKNSKILTESFQIERITGHLEILNPDVLMLSGNLYREVRMTDPDEYIMFSYKNHAQNIDSDGYLNMQTEQFNQIIIKWKGIPLIFDGQEITDTMKERITQNKQSIISVMQQVIRTLRYNADTKELEVLGPRERDLLNAQLKDKVLVFDDLATNEQGYANEITSVKKIKTANANQTLDDPILSRSLYMNDHNSMNNSLLRQTMPVSRGPYYGNRLQDSSFATPMF